MFLSSAAWSHPTQATAVFRHSAEKFDIPVEFTDYGKKWIDFYTNKIIHMRERLLEAQAAGKRFAFILDCRDLVFTAPLWSVFAKFNGLYDGRVIFGADLIGCVWPCRTERLLTAIQMANGLHAIPNAGCLAGEIDRILELYQKAVELHDELERGIFRPGVVREISGNVIPSYWKNDQFLFQVLSAYVPELFRVDVEKTLFAVFNDLFPNLNDRKKDDSRKNHTVNFAPILHSPWMANNASEWRKWARYYGLEPDARG